MLVSAVQQHALTICLRIYLPSWGSFPPPPISPLKVITGRRGHHTAPSWAHWAIRQFPTSYLFCAWECIYVSATLWIHPTLSFLPYVDKSILYVCISDVALLSWESSECIALFTSIFPWNCSESLPISMAVWAKPFQPLSPTPITSQNKLFLLSELSSLAPCWVQPSSAASLQ